MTVARTLLVTLGTPTTRVDVVADGDVTLDTLLDHLSRAAQLPPVVSRPDLTVTLARSGDPTRIKSVLRTWTLHQAGARDGDIIAVHPASRLDTAIPAPERPQEVHR